jgi:hypothetical protein
MADMDIEDLLAHGINTIDDWTQAVARIPHLPVNSNEYYTLTNRLVTQLATIVYVIQQYYIYCQINGEDDENLVEQYTYIRDRFQETQGYYIDHLVVAAGPNIAPLGPYDREARPYDDELEGYDPDAFGPDVVVGCTPEEINTHTLLFKMKKSFRDPLQQTTCSICLEDFHIGHMVRKLHCNHIYHDACICLWLGQKKTCALCVAPITSSQYGSQGRQGPHGSRERQGQQPQRNNVGRRSRRLQGLSPQ